MKYLVVLYLFAITPLAAQHFSGLSASELITPKNLELLLEKGELFHYEENIKKLRLTPDLPGLDFQNLIESSPRFTAEGMFFFPLNQEAGNISDLNLKVYNIIRNIPSLQGVTFFNPVSKETEALFPVCYQIPSLEDQNTQIPMSTLPSVPTTEMLYMFIEESQFGESRYKISITTRMIQRGSFNIPVYTVNMQNIDRLSFFNLPAIGKEKMNLSLSAFPVKIESNGIVSRGHIFYGVWTVDAPRTLPILFFKPKEFFYSRMESLRNWFRNEYDHLGN